MKMKPRAYYLLCFMFTVSRAHVDYSGHKVLTVTPESEQHLKLLHELNEKHFVDLWNEPRFVGAPVMAHLQPQLIEPVERILREHNLEYKIAFSNLQSAIETERTQHTPTNTSSEEEEYNFGKYHRYEVVVKLLKDLSTKYSNIAKLEVIGKSYENRPIYNMRISSGNNSSKPVAMMECGIHAREWASVAVGTYLVNKLITSYGSDSEITVLVDKYEFNIIVDLNPDGYVYAWDHDRLWRKSRSISSIDYEGECRGTDLNRNFDIKHGKSRSSKNPCDIIYCGEKPFSESETRALRDLMMAKKGRLSIYFSLHSFGQYWSTPYSYTTLLPPTYGEMIRISKIGADALRKKYDTQYQLGSVGNTIYETSGASLDYAYDKIGVYMAFLLELRDWGYYGFLLPENEILPMCEETWDGIKAAIEEL